MTRKIFLTALIFSILQVGYSQIVNSSCEAPDSIRNIYKEDAYRITLNRIIRNNDTYVDSVVIPQEMKDTSLRSLIAIYNVLSIPERDTVVSILNLHTIQNPFMDEVLIAADSNLSWMQQFRNGDSLSGNPSVDSLISKYNLHVKEYNDFYYSWYDYVTFESDSFYNTFVLADKFDLISEIYFSDAQGEPIDGNNITDSIFSNFHEIVFSHGWDDCPCGCMSRRFWKFRVYFDCSVEFVESWGNTIPQSIINESIIDRVSINPNPFETYLNVSPFPKQMTYKIIDINGKEIVTGQIENGIIKNLDNLQEGVYVLKLYDGKNYFMTKIIKSSR